MRFAITGEKGITPIIAIILLLMMTVAVAGAAFFWLSRIQNQMQGGVESFQGTVLTQVASSVNVMDADYLGSGSTENITIFFHNTGNTKIPLTRSATYPTTTWVLKDSNQVAICSDDWYNAPSECTSGCGTTEELFVGEIQKVVLSLSTLCSINDSTTYPGGTVFSFTVDFSGKTTASGSFIK